MGYKNPYAKLLDIPPRLHVRVYAYLCINEVGVALIYKQPCTRKTLRQKTSLMIHQ